MKSRTLCAFLIAMLLISPVAFGEIVETGDWDGEGQATGDWYGSGVYATAFGDDDYVLNWAEGWMWTYTTERCICQWFLRAYAYTEVELYLYDGDWASAISSGMGKGVCNYYPNRQAIVYQIASCSLSETGWFPDYYFDCDSGDEPLGEYDDGENWFDPYDGVFGEHLAVVEAQITSGSNCKAVGHSCVDGWGILVVTYP